MNENQFTAFELIDLAGCVKSKIRQYAKFLKDGGNPAIYLPILRILGRLCVKTVAMRNTAKEVC